MAIDPVPLDEDVHRRLRQPALFAELEEEALELRVDVRGRGVSREHRAVGAEAVVAVGAVSEGLQVCEAKEPEPVGLLECPFQRPPVGGRGQVEEGPRDGCDWDGADECTVGGSEGAGTVNSEPSAMAPSGVGDRHVGRSPGTEEAVKRSGAAMTEQRPGPTRQHGREPDAAHADHRMADGEDRSVELVEAAGRDAAVDLRRAQARITQLPTGDDAVLASGDGRDRHVRMPIPLTCVTLALRGLVNVTHIGMGRGAWGWGAWDSVGHGSTVPGRGATIARTSERLRDLFVPGPARRRVPGPT